MVSGAAAALLAALGCLPASAPGALVPSTVDEDPSLPSITLTIAGHSRGVHLRTFGDPADPVLLMLHGSLADHRAFLPYEVLADRYFVVMWDQRGSGLSERLTADEYTWRSVADEIDAVKQRYSPDAPVTLIGHSFGAMYATLYMAGRPEAVSRAVLMEPGGLTGDIFAATYPDIFTLSLLGEGLNRSFWQSEVLSASDHEVMDYKALQLLLDGHQTHYHCDPDAPYPLPVWRPGAHVEHLRGVNMQVSGSATITADYDFTVGLDDFTGPVLIIAGDCSGLGPAMQEEHHLPLFQDASLVTLPGVGHRMLVEDFEGTLAAIEAFLTP